MGCDYFADEFGNFEAVIKPKILSHKLKRTIKIETNPNEPIYKDSIGYDSESDEIEILKGKYR